MPGVERIWPGRTVVCLGGGPSLTRGDVDLACQHAAVIAVNDAYRLIPFGQKDVALYACDETWWNVHRGAPSFAGLKFAMQWKAGRWPGVTVLKNTGETGLELDPGGLRTGKNSGYQSIGLAYHLGAKRIILSGFDMQTTNKRSHWFGEHQRPLHRDSPYPTFVRMFATLVEPLAAAGVEIFNCSRESALRCFPRASLAETLGACKVAA